MSIFATQIVYQFRPRLQDPVATFITGRKERAPPPRRPVVRARTGCLRHQTVRRNSPTPFRSALPWGHPTAGAGPVPGPCQKVVVLDNNPGESPG